MREQRAQPDQVEPALQHRLSGIVGGIDRLRAERPCTEVHSLGQNVAGGEARFGECGLELAQDAAVPGSEVEDPLDFHHAGLKHREAHAADRRAAR